jgi:uncharacterized protein (DUF2336 family)
MSEVAVFAAIFKPQQSPQETPQTGRPESRSLIDELNDAVAAGGEKERQRILERIADLLAVGSRGYSSDQIALFDDVLRQLAADIEVKVRVRLSRRFAHIDTAPPKLIRVLAFDESGDPQSGLQ